MPTSLTKKKMLRDVDLVDDIISLRKRLAEAERQRDNALDVLKSVQDERYAFRWLLHDINLLTDDKLIKDKIMAVFEGNYKDVVRPR